MNALPSSDFRKLYPGLREPTEVTVNGHVIGTWIPAGQDHALVAEVAHLKRELAARPGILVPETLGPDVRTTGEPILPATKRVTPSSAWTDEDAQVAANERRGRQKLVDEALRKANRTKKP